MYFDLQPKSRIEDLFDMEDELERLLSLLKGRRAAFPMVVVRGRRRTGKTSLIKTALTASGLPHVLLDGMAFSEMPKIKKRSLLRLMEQELNRCVREQASWRKRMLEVLRGVRWVRVNSEPPWVHFEWDRPDRELDPLNLIQSFRELVAEARTKFILVLDEAQEFKRMVGLSFQRLLAHLYDYVPEIQIIVSGSQVGLLHEFLGTHDASSPLFGRGMAEVEVSGLPPEKAFEFLRAGMEQAGLEADRVVISSAVQKLGGTTGWLTLFGAKAVEAGRASDEVLESTIKTACELEAKEFSNFLKVRKRASRRYYAIMRATARMGEASWVNLKKSLEVEEGKKVADNIFSNLLQELVKAGFIEKRGEVYSTVDPIMRRVFQVGLVRMH